jgi:hypothetical protein
MLTRARNLAKLVLFDVRIFLATTLLLLLTLCGCGDSGPSKADLPKALYGPPPPNDGGAKDGCLARALYGPLACQNDSDCVQWSGAGWYCDKTNQFDDGCGNKTSWAICKSTTTKDAGPAKDGCIPVALYGPKPCQNDSECVADHGAGWYCDLTNSFGNGCGGISTWPMCRPASTDAGIATRDGCIPAALYGPKPCQSDTDCQSWYGAGYTCDKTNTYNDGCGHNTTWPICKKP